MTDAFSFDPGSFKGMEQAGWQRNAAGYDDLLGSVTRYAIEPLLDATAVRAGTLLLKVCCVTTTYPDQCFLLRQAKGTEHV